MTYVKLLLIVSVISSCSKKVSFETTNAETEYFIRLNLAEIGSPSRITIHYISYWDDTIIWKGVKLPPIKDTIRTKFTSDYYGVDTVQKFEKYKAKNWYIKREYEFSPW